MSYMAHYQSNNDYFESAACNLDEYNVWVNIRSSFEANEPRRTWGQPTRIVINAGHCGQ